MKQITWLLLWLPLIAAASEQSLPDADSFKVYVANLKLTERSPAEAAAILSKEGFTCSAVNDQRVAFTTACERRIPTILGEQWHFVGLAAAKATGKSEVTPRFGWRAP